MRRSHYIFGKVVVGALTAFWIAVGCSGCSAESVEGTDITGMTPVAAGPASAIHSDAAATATLDAATAPAVRESADTDSAAPIIVVGRCLSQASQWHRNRTLIYTHVQFKTLQVIKGDVGPQFEILVLGGEVGRIAQIASHQPSFRPGHVVQLALVPSAEGLKIFREGVRYLHPTDWDAGTERAVR